MRISHLRDFIILAKHNNFLEAADELYISQSTLSKHIQTLEKELDVQLFTRSTRTVQLSPFGKVYLPHAQRLVDDYDKSLAELNQFKDELQQTIIIGTIPIMASYGITQAIMAFSKYFPKAKVRVIEADSHRLMTILDNGECDIAFIREDHKINDVLTGINFSSDRLVAVLPKTHKLAKNRNLSLQELSNETFLFLQPGTTMYDLSVNSCRSAGFEPVIAYTGNRAENILDLVKEGMGISLLMEKPISFLNPKGVSLIPIIPEIQTDIKLLHSKNRKPASITKAFLDFISETTLSVSI